MQSTGTFEALVSELSTSLKLMPTKKLSNICAAIIGSPDFCRRINSLLVSSNLGVRTVSGIYAEAWGLFLTHRPNVLLLEIGFHYSEKNHAAARKFLEQVRERFGSTVYIIVALVACERLFFGGDLLFATEQEAAPSGFIDTFVASPPPSIPSIAPLAEQILHAIKMCANEMVRRLEGKVPLPPLGQAGWVQSLADPLSRELWMQWLPRYASYTNENPIIIGQTGTGKTNLAYALHLLSGRKGQFIGITPRDFSSSELIQAELFGAVPGAYTGAVDKWGLVKSAEKGTLFIDELQSIDKELQGKLITFIENKVYRRVGSAESIEADVRFVFASNRTLYDMMESDVLRHDFAYRLERVQLELQPLHQRRLDIPAALAYALAKVRRQRPHAFPVFGFNSGAYRLLFSHPWPGNLRQLENNVAQLCELADMNETHIIDEQIVTQVFQSRLRGLATTCADIIGQAALVLADQAISDTVDSLEQGMERFVEIVRSVALAASGGDLERAAQIIGDDRALLALVSETASTRREIRAHKGES